jgi:hypothetical protein
MLKQAQENFPNLETQSALQAQADLGPGHEASKGEGAPCWAACFAGSAALLGPHVTRGAARWGSAWLPCLAARASACLVRRMLMVQGLGTQLLSRATRKRVLHPLRATALSHHSTAPRHIQLLLGLA